MRTKELDIIAWIYSFVLKLIDEIYIYYYPIIWQLFNPKDLVGIPGDMILS